MSQSRLFSPGERLGWEFRDRLRQWRRFPEPEPRSVVADPELRARLDRLTARRRSAVRWAVAAAVCGALAFWYLVDSLGRGGSTAGVVLAAAVLLGALWLVVWRPLRLAVLEWEARRALGGLQVKAQARRDDAGDTWRRRADAYNAVEWERVNDIPEWGAVRSWPDSGRIDVFGGTLRSWEGFLTTFGASMIGTAPPLRILDLSEGMVAGELCQLAAAGGVAVSAQVLPAELATCDLLADLDADWLTDVLVESIHGDRGDQHREVRAMDSRILGAICGALAPPLTLARVHEALLVAMREPGELRHLTPEEREGARGLFSDDYVRQAHDRFRSLEAHLHPLRELGSRSAGQRHRDAPLQCLSIGSGEQVLATDLFVDVAVQWAIRDVTPPATLVVAGADRLRRRHLERLADVCDRRGVKLVVLFRHLRDDAEELLGAAGTAVFMRLGNHAEAERAARFIGQGHRFVLSSLTRGHGGEQTHERGETEDETAGKINEPFQMASTRIRSRTWGATKSYAEGTNWHYAETVQRVHEYFVEPTALQNLPDYALLVVQHGQGFEPAAGQLAARPRLQVADCNPDIVTLPRVLTEPFAEPAHTPALPARGESQGGGS